MYPPGRPYCSFGLREGDFLKHCLIAGATGTGKTNLGFHLVRELRKKQKPVLIFDWKRSYRELLQLPDCRDIVVFTVGRDSAPFHFNPLIPPPGVEPGEWLIKLLDVLLHSFFAGAGVEMLLRQALNYVYSTCGWYDGTRTHTPTFLAAREFLRKQRVTGRMALWHASSRRILEDLCFPHGLHPIVNTSKTWDHQRLLQKTVILELDALSDNDKVFLTEALILWIYEYRKAHGKREQFEHCLVVEEGHHILAEYKQRDGETVMETCLRQIREFGESVIVLDQEPGAKLSSSVIANTATKIILNLGNGKDIEDMRRTLGLTRDERGYFNLLAVGHALASMQGRIPRPVHVAFPRIALEKGRITDKDITRKNTENHHRG